MTTNELSELLPLLTKDKECVLISNKQRQIIQAVQGHANFLHIENEDNTIDWQSQPLPNCPAGYHRLWSKRDWELTENIRQETIAKANRVKEEMAAAYARMQAMRNAITEYFTSIGVPSIITEKNILAGADSEKLWAIISGLNCNGANIKVK